MSIGILSRRATVWTVAVAAVLGGLYWFERTMYYGISAPFETELQLNNRVGQAIAFYTDHTKKTVQIPAGATVMVPHTDGTVVITTTSGTTWTYSSVEVPGPELENEVRRAHLRLTLPLTVEPTGTFLLPSGKRIVPLITVTKP